MHHPLNAIPRNGSLRLPEPSAPFDGAHLEITMANPWQDAATVQSNGEA